MKICETCVMDYLNRLIKLERYMNSWRECETDELLLAIGELQTEENITHMDMAREML